MTINWEWLENMVAAVAKTMPDGEEYQSFAMVWIYQQLEQYMAKTKNPPNFRRLVSWSASYYRRMKAVRDADSNLGDETNIRFERIDPADQVAIKLDTAEFLTKLNRNQHTVLDLTLKGYSGIEIAGTLKVSCARVSQLRREVRDKATVHLIEYY